MSRKRFMIAAPASGSGKTLITCGLMRLLVRNGYQIQSFKCGPDFIDPMFHRHLTGRPAGNLDAFFSEPEGLRGNIAGLSGDADLTVIEGVMGYYDGIGFGSARASSCEVAQITDTPVILVVNARGCSTTLLPVLQGMLAYPGGEQIRGIILNHISKGVYPAMKQMIESALPVRVAGYLPDLPDVRLESRHLGLLLPEEIRDLDGQLDKVADCLAETMDLSLLMELSEAPAPVPDDLAEFRVRENELREAYPVRIGVADDAAFCFFYEENLRMLETAGAELVRFSPLRDRTLPEGLDALLLVGGYPELHAAELSGNSGMRKAILQAHLSGLPILAECGGFLYLHETLEDPDGIPHAMCGVIPAHAWHTRRLTRFGYITLQEGTVFGQPVGDIRAHEFHHYDSTLPGDAFLAVKPSGTRSWRCIHSTPTLYAGFPHLYYPANPEILSAFLQAARTRTR